MDKNDKITSETIVTGPELACVLGKTYQRIRQLVQDGIIQNVSTGKYNLSASVKNYLDYLQKKGSSKEMEHNINQANVDLKTSKAALLKAEARHFENSFIPADLVEIATNDLITTIKKELTDLTDRIIHCVDTSKSQGENSVLIRTEVYKAMERISKYKYVPNEQKP